MARKTVKRQRLSRKQGDQKQGSRKQGDQKQGSRKQGDRKQGDRKQGGASFSGPSVSKKPSTLDRLASYWHNNLERHVWWSQGQEGYYFSNITTFYMSKTHTHIYGIEDLDDKKDGLKRVHYTTKSDNKHVEKNATIDLYYNDIVSWLTAKNDEIGAR